ncbi:MAG: hypothetical protein IKC63_03355, partial [Clostridia bacterium]|nr:hypothetical protein [Clostridia bacterium]
MKNRSLKVVIVAIAILTLVSVIGLTAFAAPEVIETKELTVENGTFDFYTQTRTNASDETKTDYRIVAVMNEEWLIDIAYAEVEITFSGENGTKILKAVPQTVYNQVYADTEEGRTMYTASEGNILLGWVVTGVPSGYTVTSATVDVSADITVEDALSIADRIEETTEEAYTVSGTVTAVDGNTVTLEENGAVITVTVVTDSKIYVGNTVTVTGNIAKEGMINATLDALCYYTVTVEESANGTVTLSKNENLVPGDTLTVTAVAAEGFKLVAIKVNGEAVEAVDGVYTLTVNENITVSAEFEEDAPAISTLATFEFGANGAATHKDGNDLGASKSYSANGYTLALTGMSKVFGPAYDSTGKSCLKLGTGKVVGSFTFTVPADVTTVVINVAQYKTNTTNITINGT